MYMMKNCTKERLEKLGFKYSGLLSYSKETYYTYRFIAYKYRDSPMIEAEISVMLEDGSANVSVFGYRTRSRYAPWYCKGTLGYDGKNEVVEEIDRLIEKYLKKFGIKEVG